MKTERTKEELVRIAKIAQTLLDTQFESRYDDLLEDLGNELLELSGVCGICFGEEDDDEDRCPSCGGSGLQKPSA